MVSKRRLQRNKALKEIHQLIDSIKDAGLSSRQELVSMLPPILCDIKSHHSVMDMCAAPGSKTAQILELIMNDHYNKNKKNNLEPYKGFVVANDADSERSFLLTHQI